MKWWVFTTEIQKTTQMLIANLRLIDPTLQWTIVFLVQHYAEIQLRTPLKTVMAPFLTTLMDVTHFAKRWLAGTARATKVEPAVWEFVETLEKLREKDAS